MRQILLAALLCIAMPIARAKDVAADTTILKRHVCTLAQGPGFRNIRDTAALNRVAGYIAGEMRRYTDHVYTQSYDVKYKSYQNVIASFGPESAPRIIVGAHYDACGDQQGADDNASGISALLELCRLFNSENTRDWKYRVDLVAYTLEEPPTFETPEMGSAIHAQSLVDDSVNVVGMISIEMVGFYRDERHTQHFPVGALKYVYGTRGNFITVVHRLKGGPFTRHFTHRFKRGPGIFTKVFSAPKWVVGIDFSDHLNYWARGWEAVMITDTSFYRNKNYHQRTDTPDTLDYVRMAAVVNNMFRALKGMAS